MAFNPPVRRSRTYPGLFVTGTDTGIGKTWASLGLIARLQAEGYRVAGMKPVASGCNLTPEGLRNDDALALADQADVALPYAIINPYAYEPPIAPHLAAAGSRELISLERIGACYRAARAAAEVVVVEGVGGWKVPLNRQETVADLARYLGLPVVLVVGIRLGCLNHALLTAESMAREGQNPAGWVANRIEPSTACAEENIATLVERIDAPFLGCIPWLSNPDPAIIAGHLSLPPPPA